MTYWIPRARKRQRWDAGCRTPVLCCSTEERNWLYLTFFFFFFGCQHIDCLCTGDRDLIQFPFSWLSHYEFNRTFDIES